MRGIVAHRAECFHTVARHRGKERTQGLEGVAKGLLAGHQSRRIIRATRFTVGQILQFDHVLVEPFLVGMFVGNRLL